MKELKTKLKLIDVNTKHKRKERNLYNKYNNNNISNNKNNISSFTSLVQYALSAKFQKSYSTEILLKALGYSQQRQESIQLCMEQGFVKKDLYRTLQKDTVLNLEFGCNSRVCPHCANQRQKKYRRELKEIVSQYEGACRFLTIGMIEVQHLTKDYIKRCNRAISRTMDIIRKLKNPFTKQKYSFGNYVNVMEIKHHKAGDVKKNKKGQVFGHYDADSWNIHYHIVYEGDYIPQKLLAEKLRKQTKAFPEGVSSYVFINYIQKDSIRNKFKAMNYIAKYISKMDFELSDYSLTLEYLTATKRVNFVKISGIKSSKTANKFIRLVDFYVYSGKDYWDVKERVTEIGTLFDKCQLSQFSLSQSDYENYIQFASDDIFIGALDRFEKIRGEI